MKKSLNKTTVVIVLAFFLVLSVGYALFSDTITIQGTATAQGDFNIETTCITGVESNLDSIFEVSSSENGYTNDSCTVSDNTVTMSVDFEYPGAARYFQVDIKNTSSIDAAVEINSDGHVPYENAVSNLKVTDITTNEVTEKSYVGIEQQNDTFGVDFPYLSLGFNVLKLEDGSYLVDEDKYLENGVFYKDSTGKNYMKLSQNETITVVFYTAWDQSSDKQGYTSETTFTMPINVKQLTSDMEVDTAFESCIFGC